MASGLPEKMSVTMVLAAIRRLQQRDCPGFSPDSLLIAVHPHSYSGTWRLRTNCGCKGKHKSRNNKVFL